MRDWKLTVVTDSTAYLPPDLCARLGIEVVSLYYDLGDGEWLREASVTDHGAFYEHLRAAATLPITSPPFVEDFVAAYEPALADGDSVLSIHISSGLSETCSAARSAKQQLADSGKGGERIHVVDSASTGALLGLLVLIAARAAADGQPAEAVVDRVREARMSARLWVLLDTLEFLKRGGRVGSATAWIGSTLNIKPILTIESEMKAVERVRTRARGIERLVDFARQMKASGADAWGVQHAAAEDEARLLVERLQEIFWRPPFIVSEIGPVIGTHTGPGLLGIGGVPARFLS